jgi:hypothetical protein
MQLEHGVFSIYLAPLSGMIFAMLLYAIFASGLLRGSVFPDIQAEHANSLFSSFLTTHPHDAKGYFLLVVWCFIAGFAEQFVPDVLDSLLARTNKKGEFPTSGVRPAPGQPDDK